MGNTTTKAFILRGHCDHIFHFSFFTFHFSLKNFHSFKTIKNEKFNFYVRYRNNFDGSHHIHCLHVA
jgi:hypothetical protein